MCVCGGRGSRGVGCVCVWHTGKKHVIWSCSRMCAAGALDSMCVSTATLWSRMIARSTVVRNVSPCCDVVEIGCLKGVGSFHKSEMLLVMGGGEVCCVDV